MLISAPQLPKPPSTKFWFCIVDNPGPVKIEDVKRVICDHFKITSEDLLAHRRDHDLAHPRQIGMYLAKSLSKKSFYEVARRFERDRTTVTWAFRKIRRLIESDKSLAREIAQIRGKLG